MPFSSYTFSQFREVFLQALLAFPRFLKNPIQGMRDLPDWEWPLLIALQAALGLACGFIGAALSGSILLMITSVIVAPISVLFMSFIFSGFFYYTFLFFFKKEVPFRLVFTHLLFASIPVLVCNIISPIIPFIGVLGVIATGLLLYVGFRENLSVDDKRLRYFIGGLVVAYILLLAVQLVRFHQPDQNLKIRATPESLEILEKELQGELEN